MSMPHMSEAMLTPVPKVALEMQIFILTIIWCNLLTIFATTTKRQIRQQVLLNRRTLTASKW